MKIKRWYHRLIEFFGVNTGPWYRVTYTANMMPDATFRLISAKDAEL